MATATKGAATKKAPAKKPAAGKKTAAKTETPAEAPAAEVGTKLNVSGKKAANAVLADVELSRIVVEDGFNPRHRLGEIVHLQASIKKDGLVNPLTVRPGEGDKLRLVAGERRFTAVSELGWANVPVVIRQDLEDDTKAKAVAVAENSPDGRSNLTPVELGKAFLDFKNEGWSPARIASETGVHPQRVRRCLTLVEAPEDVQKAVEDGKVGLMAANEFSKLDDGTREQLRERLHEGMSAAQVREEGKKLAKANKTEEAPEPGKRANRATGAQRQQQIKTWRGRRVCESTLVELCALIVGAEGEERESADFFEIRGAAAAILWFRGDLDSPILPSADGAKAAEKKVLKHFDSLVEAEAARYEGDGEGEDEE